ncbi:MAG: hypothetical protein PCFJNLEI_03961 [Verrucomicrobiae bacterium]|nr:hypothetical protein [Verrucomicrobiae bacterium]
MHSIDWAALQRLRAGFLAGATNYWQSESDLASYDQTFAQRIGWKWDFVLAELKRLGWQPPAGPVLDWGCGSGIAGRAFLGEFPATEMVVWDRSEFALNFATRRLAERFPNVSVRRGRAGTTLLVSHVITELPDLNEIVKLAREATAVIWVEPGTFAASRRLAEVRESVRGHIVAPCPHRGECGLLNSRHWCHFFAPSPPAIYRDGDWARFAKMAGVDLRSLPVSYLVLDQRPTPPVPATRVIGRPRVYKAHSLELTCSAAGVADVQKKNP